MAVITPKPSYNLMLEATFDDDLAKLKNDRLDP